MGREVLLPLDAGRGLKAAGRACRWLLLMLLHAWLVVRMQPWLLLIPLGWLLNSMPEGCGSLEFSGTLCQ